MDTKTILSPTYRADRQWSELLIPEIKRIIAPYLICEADCGTDRNEATDLIVFVAKDMRIAARVRRFGYADKYPNDFTIRSMRDSGAKTELQKISEGWGDWMFYGHASADDKTIDRWMIIDLHAWRCHMIRRGHGATSAISFRLKSNSDGTHFYTYDASTFPPNPPILIARG